MAAAKEKQILVVIKEPGKAPYVEPRFENTLEAFQKAVGGYIETVTIEPGLVLICNEEGRYMGFPQNVSICGIDFVGTVIATAFNQRGDFKSIRSSNIPFVLGFMRGDSSSDFPFIDAAKGDAS